VRNKREKKAMANVLVHEHGKPIMQKITRLFDHAGPHMLGTRRLDQMISATVIRDASTVSTVATSVGTSKTSTTSAVARGVVGGIVAGPLGALIGGTGASQNTASTTVSVQTTVTDVYMQLQFKHEVGPIAIQVKDEEAFSIIHTYVGCSEWTQAQLDEAKSLVSALRARKKIEFEAERARKIEDAAASKIAKKYMFITLIIALSAFTTYAVLNPGASIFLGYIFSGIISAIVYAVAYALSAK
jgi:hypothetical protein